MRAAPAAADVAADVVAAAAVAAAAAAAAGYKPVAAAVVGRSLTVAATASAAADPWLPTGSRNPCLEPTGDSGPADSAATNERNQGEYRNTGQQFPHVMTIEVAIMWKW